MEYTPKTKPLSHQQEDFDLHKDKAAWALFWEQGTGKTKEAIDRFCYNVLMDRVDALLVIAPNGVHLNWIKDEIPAHMPDDMRAKTKCLPYLTQKAGTKWFQRMLADFNKHKGVAVLTVSYDAFMTKEGKLAIWKFLSTRRVFMVADESIAIKNPMTDRTKSLLKASVFGPMRMLLNGTPVGNGPFDVYSQVKFLDEHFWEPYELSTYTEFKTYFGIFRKQVREDGREWQQLVGYRRLNELYEMLKQIATRVLKEDVLDLPPKLYSKRYFTPTPQQRKHYEELKEEFVTYLEEAGTMLEEQLASWRDGLGDGTYDEEAVQQEAAHRELGTMEESHREQMALADDYEAAMLEGIDETVPVTNPYFEADEVDVDPNRMVSAPLAIVRMMRMQQVLSGYLPIDDSDELTEIPGGNPRLDLLCEIAEGLPHKFIIWAPKFRRDIELILARLEKMGIKAVGYHGGLSHNERARNAEAFKKVPMDEGGPQAIVCSWSASRGHTWVCARTVIYYTNDYQLVHRLQSEDRAHRIGQTNPVSYIDIVGEDTIDLPIVAALREKFDIARQITGDRLRDWLK